MGYVGYSMSERAKIAYNNGEMPISRWTKDDILSNVEKLYSVAVYDLAKTASTAVLKKVFLKRTSWHHTSNHFNKTDFYSFNDDMDWLLTLDLLKMEITASKIREKKPKPIKHYALVKFTSWEGTRKHPKPVENIAVATWTQSGYDVSMAVCEKTHKDYWPISKRVSSLSIIEEYKTYPRSNSQIWKKTK